MPNLKEKAPARSFPKNMSTDIVPKSPENSQELQVFNPEADVEKARMAAKALMGIIESKPKKVLMNGELYLEFEDWQTIGQFFNHSVGTQATEEIIRDGKLFGYMAKAVLYNKDGVIVGGAEASCMRDEPNWKSKPEFQLKSMAQTRAMSKALRSKFGFVAVLAGAKPTPAEEMDSVVHRDNFPIGSRNSPKKDTYGHSIRKGSIEDAIGAPEKLRTENQEKLIKNMMAERGIKKLSDIGINPPVEGKTMFGGIYTFKFAHDIINQLEDIPKSNLEIDTSPIRSNEIP